MGALLCKCQQALPSSHHPHSLSSTNPTPSSSPTTTTTTTTTTTFSGNQFTNSSSSSSSFSSSQIFPSLLSPAEISAAETHPLALRLSSSSSRSSIRNRDVLIHLRRFRADPQTLPSRLSLALKSHHRSLARLLAASLSPHHIHLVYEFSPGTPLSTCLRNPQNPQFTALNSWLSRIQIAADVAQGLDYIHHHSVVNGSVHNRIKSSAIIVSETNTGGFNAKICYFGAALLAGDIEKPNLVEGVRGYLAPEVIAGGCVTTESDVFAFGVVILELISGDEPVTYRLRAGGGNGYERVSVVEAAREVVGAGTGWEERRERVRRWVDRRLRDSFPLDVVEKMVMVGLRCVEGDAAKRPGMSWVEGKISQLFLESKRWSEKIRVPVDVSASFGPR